MIATVTLRLARAQVLERVVEIRGVEGLAEAFAGADRRRLRLRRLPVLDRRGLRGLPPRRRLLVLPAGRPGDADPRRAAGALARGLGEAAPTSAHTDRAAAYRAYTEHYAATSGQLYRSDTLQMADYDDGYHRVIDAALGAAHPSTEMISELYVPRERLADFMRGRRRGAARDGRTPDLRDGPADRARHRHGARVGQGAVGMRDREPLHRAHAGGDRPLRVGASAR